MHEEERKDNVWLAKELQNEEKDFKYYYFSETERYIVHDVFMVLEYMTDHQNLPDR